MIFVLAAIMYLGVTGASAPACSAEVGWVSTVQQHTLYLSDPAKSTDVLTWHDARQACTQLNPQAALAACPRDIYDQTISCKIEPAVPYWVGITATYPLPSKIFWIDGSLETRSSQFSVDSNLNSNVNETCGHVNLTIHSIFHRPLDWTLSDCSARRPYICLIDKAPTATSSSTTPLLSTTSVTPANHKISFSKSLQDIMLKLQDFITTVDLMLKMAHTQNEDSETQMPTSAILDVLFKTEEFIDSTLRNGALLSNFSQRFSYVDITLMHIQLQSLPGLEIKMENVHIEVENFTFRDHGSTSKNATLTNRLSLNDTGILENVTAIVAVVLLDVPQTQVNTDKNMQNNMVIKSPVLSLTCTAGPFKIDLQHKFTIWARHFLEVEADPLCGFQTYHKTNEIWSTYGCEYIKATQPLVDLNSTMVPRYSNGNTNRGSKSAHDSGNQMYVTCSCNHTTNFAVLMQVVNFQVSRADRLALSVVTYIGCSASIISMIIAITVFCCLRSLNSERVCVHRNLCIAMLAAQLTFISGINAVDEPTICAVIALLLHYLVSASLVWMLVEGLHLYCQVVSVFGTWHARMKYYAAFGWGVPAVLVAVSAAVDWRGYGTKFSCWLSIERSTIWMFVGPVVAIILINSVILASVMKIAMAAAGQDKRTRFAPVKAGAKAGLFLCPLMGLTWISGLAAVSRDLVVFQYIFSTLNSLQGFFIFLFHCVLNTEVQQTLRRAKEKRSLQKIGLPGSSSSSQGQSSSVDSRSPPTSARASPGLGTFLKRTAKVNPDMTRAALKDSNNLVRGGLATLKDNTNLARVEI